MDSDVLQPSNIQRQQTPIWHMFRIVHAYIQPGEPEMRPRNQQVLGVLQRLGQLFVMGTVQGIPETNPPTSRPFKMVIELMTKETVVLVASCTSNFEPSRGPCGHHEGAYASKVAI